MDLVDPSIGLWGLFFSAFISATVAPGGSEAVLAFLVSQSAIAPVLLLVTATAGNTLGALTTWWLGQLTQVRCPPGRLLSPRHRRAVESVRRWGAAALLFSWLPVVGDALCFAGGWLRLPFAVSLAAIVAGKALRYWAVAYLFLA